MKSEVDQQILKALADWELDKGSLPPLLRLYRQLLGIQSEARAKIQLPVSKLAPAEIKASLYEGKILLNFADLPLDWQYFQELFKETASSVTACLELKTVLPGPASQIATLKLMTEDWYQGKALGAYGENEYVLELILHNAIKPFLSAAAIPLAAAIDQELWLRNICPVCGGAPDFAYLDKERGARHLICARCDTTWLFKRMECPYCSNRNQDHLAYFTSDNGLYRLYVCEKCKNYLKAIDLRATEKPILLPLERLMTLDLDEQACRNGYAVYGSRDYRKQEIGSN